MILNTRRTLPEQGGADRGAGRRGGVTDEMDVSLDCSIRQARNAGRRSFAQAATLQLEAVSAMNNAVDNGIPNRQIAEHFDLPLTSSGSSQASP